MDGQHHDGAAAVIANIVWRDLKHQTVTLGLAPARSILAALADAGLAVVRMGEKCDGWHGPIDIELSDGTTASLPEIPCCFVTALEAGE